MEKSSELVGKNLMDVPDKGVEEILSVSQM